MVVVVRVGQVGTRVDGAGSDGIEGLVTRRNVPAGSIGGVVGCMPVVGGHCMPEGAQCRTETGGNVSNGVLHRDRAGKAAS